MSFRESIYYNSFPLHHWGITRKAWDIYKFLNEGFDYKTVEDISKYQDICFNDLINIISNNWHHPFYGKIKDLSHRKIVVTTKEDIRNNPNFHINKNAYKITTSGSTGEPLTIYANREQLEIRMATTLKNLSSTGYKFGDRTIRLWHSTIGMSYTHVIKERLDAFLSNRAFLPIFKIDDNVILKYLDFINEYKPELIDGYVEAFNLFARVLIKYKDKKSVRNFLNNFKVKSIVTSAQTLTDDVRDFWENNFKCVIYDKYGSREFSGIAFQCVYGSYHVNNESYMVDYKKIHDNYSEIYITDLLNKATPLIRYKIGDIVSNELMYKTGECPCGRQNHTIGKPQGRIQAIIYGLNNTYLLGAFFAHYMKDFGKTIKLFQFIQNKEDELEFHYVSNTRSDVELTSDLNKICMNISERLGGIKIVLFYWDDIEMVPTGKRNHSICNLDKFRKGFIL